MKRDPKYPLKHLSIRVPWHDNGWNGTVCANPKGNTSCLVLKNCSQNRDDEKEQLNACKKLKDLHVDDLPICTSERGMFMSEDAISKMIEHPYAELSEHTHGHIKPTPFRFSPYSAGAIPFRWLNKNEAQNFAELYDLDFDVNREPELKFNTGWLNEYQNQKAMFDCFFGHIEANVSLVFFYAKQVPFIESSQRVLIGIGKITKEISDSVEYNYEAEGGLKTLIWEHLVHHSIRPDSKNGFLLPYHKAIEYSEKHPDFDPSELAVLVPPDKTLEFSYASEHASNDTAIQLLLAADKSIRRCQELGIGENHLDILKWIHNTLLEVEKIRGPYPGLGVALTAFGFSEGHYIATSICNQLGEEDDPWQLIDKMFDTPSDVLSDELCGSISKTVRDKYKSLKEKNPTRIELLQLISRFELSIDQAETIYVQEERVEAGLAITDEELIENPYLIYEATRLSEYPISFHTIDMGLFSTKKQFILLPTKSNIDDVLDKRRIRALTIYELEKATSQGHTLLPRITIVNDIREMPLKPECLVDGDIYSIAENIFENEIEIVKMRDGSPAYQLTRLNSISKLIAREVSRRKSGRRHIIDADWRKLLDEEFKNVELNELEENARQEKALALSELAESRFSVLIGGAGTGKTTLLKILCSHPDIGNSVLFLAPTGKARVRMQQAVANINIPAYTLAQFLGRYNRYSGKTQRYFISDDSGEKNYKTVIVDEASMMTEEMLGALLDCLKGAQRLILVGDHRQLPPIGAGRPFVDIIRYLQPENIENIFPRVWQSYCELTITRRQKGQERLDLQLANWFSGNQISPGEDDIFEKISKKEDMNNLRIEKWNNEDELKLRLQEIMSQELKIEDVNQFNLSLGAYDGTYFNWGQAVKYVDKWQILTPVRERYFGVKALNRHIHKKYRNDMLEFAKRQYKIPKPMGPEEIVYGDKVINLWNHRRTAYKDDGLNYIANGEIGIAMGQFKKPRDNFRGRPQYLKIEFTSQEGYSYSFKEWDFKEEGDIILELAYALTIHKSQGSDFGMVILILPYPIFVLSRELLYTALTRQKEKVILLHQGDFFELGKFSQDKYSDTLQRLTNIFYDPSPIKIEDRYLEENLIHVASDRTLLRSKSELIIYERLLNKGCTPLYEKELVVNDVRKIPDFTIEDAASGINYYWEHCGLLADPGYHNKWLAKKEWYKQNGILPIEEGGGPNGVLIETLDSAGKGISIPEIDEIIDKHLI